jgi:hypothetical protein
MIRCLLIGVAFLWLISKPAVADGSESNEVFDAGLKSFPLPLEFSDSDSLFVIHKPKPFD